MVVLYNLSAEESPITAESAPRKLEMTSGPQATSIGIPHPTRKQRNLKMFTELKSVEEKLQGRGGFKNMQLFYIYIFFFQFYNLKKYSSK